MSLTDSQRWLILAMLIFFCLLFYLLGPVLTPFAVGALLAYLGDPIVDRLERRKLSRTGAVVIVFMLMTLVMTILVLILLPTIVQQLSGLIRSIPGYIDAIATQWIPWISEKLGLELEPLNVKQIPSLIGSHISEAGVAVKGLFEYVGRSSGRLFAFLANLFLIPVVTFYMLRDWDKFVAAIHHLLPRQVEPVVSQLARESDEVLSAFLRGQLMVMISLATIYSIGLSLVGIKFALIIGIVAGLVSFIPYMGVVVGVSIACLAVMLQTQDPVQLVLVLAVFGVGQFVESAFLTPLLVGDRIGLHPVAVIFAVLAGGQLFGFVGVLVALPVAAVLAVIVRELHARYMKSQLYDSGKPDQDTGGGDRQDKSTKDSDEVVAADDTSEDARDQESRPPFTS